MRSAWVLDGRTHPRQVGPRVPGPAGRSPRRGHSAQAHSPDEAQGGSPVSVRVGHLAPRGQYGRSSRSIAACGSRPASPDAASYSPASSRAVPSSRHTHNVNVVHDELPSFVCRSLSPDPRRRPRWRPSSSARDQTFFPSEPRGVAKKTDCFDSRIHACEHYLSRDNGRTEKPSQRRDFR